MLIPFPELIPALFQPASIPCVVLSSLKLLFTGLRIDFKNVTYLSAVVDVSTGYFHSPKQCWKPEGIRCCMWFQGFCLHLLRDKTKQKWNIA